MSVPTDAVDGSARWQTIIQRRSLRGALSQSALSTRTRGLGPTPQTSECARCSLVYPAMPSNKRVVIGLQLTIGDPYQLESFTRRAVVPTHLPRVVTDIDN